MVIGLYAEAWYTFKMRELSMDWRTPVPPIQTKCTMPLDPRQILDAISDDKPIFFNLMDFKCLYRRENMFVTNPLLVWLIGIWKCWSLWRGNPENPEKNPWSKEKNQKRTQPTYNVGSGN